MKPIIIIIGTLTLILSNLQGETTQKLGSKVRFATIFQGQVLVTREASIDLTEGPHKLLVSNLTTSLVDASVRVSGSGTGKAKILEVKTETVFTAESQDAFIKKSNQKLDSLSFLIQSIEDEILVLQSQKNFIESLKAETAQQINKEIAVRKPTIQDWQLMLKFISQNLNEINTSIRQANQKINKLKDVKRAIERNMREASSNRGKNYKEITVSVLVENPGKQTFLVSYLVRAASWYPMYDARVDLNNQKVEWIYYGMIQQNTGEDWNDINLTLSTAMPMTVDRIPMLTPQYIGLSKPGSQIRSKAYSKIQPGYFRVTYREDKNLPRGKGRISGRVYARSTREPLIGVNVIVEGTTLGASTNTNGDFTIDNLDPGDYTLQFNYIGYRNLKANIYVYDKKNTQLNIALEETTIELGEAIVVTAERLKPEDMGYLTSDVRASQGSVVFDIPVKTSIPSDNSAHKVTIAIESLDVLPSYTTTPKIMQTAFLQGKIVNSSTYPFLEGDVNVFLGNEFVNQTSIDYISSKDTMELSLGTDPAIKVQRKLINKFSESSGFTSGKRKVTYEYQIIITNNRNATTAIQVNDQFPLSQNEKIKIKLEAPDEKIAEIDELNNIHWRLVLPAGETQTLPLKFEVEYPKDLQISGL